jgi:hypothetical protein
MRADLQVRLVAVVHLRPIRAFGIDALVLVLIAGFVGIGSLAAGH